MSVGNGMFNLYIYFFSVGRFIFFEVVMLVNLIVDLGFFEFN